MASRLILASHSPRRKALLETLVKDFEVETSGLDETSQLKDPYQLTKDLALKKAQKVAYQYPDAWVLGADTLVVYHGTILGKPASLAEAFKTLFFLKNQVHEVVTGVALVKGNQVLDSYEERARVTFKDYSDELIKTYIRAYPVLDYAGSYGLQDPFVQDHFLDRLEGEKETVVGLPLARLRKLLERYDLV